MLAVIVSRGKAWPSPLGRGCPATALSPADAGWDRGPLLAPPPRTATRSDCGQHYARYRLQRPAAPPPDLRKGSGFPANPAPFVLLRKSWKAELSSFCGGGCSGQRPLRKAQPFLRLAIQFVVLWRGCASPVEAQPQPRNKIHSMPSERRSLSASQGGRAAGPGLRGPTSRRRPRLSRRGFFLAPWTDRRPQHQGSTQPGAFTARPRPAWNKPHAHAGAFRGGMMPGFPSPQSNPSGAPGFRPIRHDPPGPVTRLQPSRSLTG